PAGIGPEICLRLLNDPRAAEISVPIIFGDAAILSRLAQQLDLPVPARVITPPDGARGLREIAGPAVLDVRDVEHPAAIQPGVVSPATGRAAMAYIERSIEAALAGDVDAVTTGPIHKEALR